MAGSSPYLPSTAGFGGLPEGYAAASSPEATVIPFGLEATVTFGGGTARGPAAILAASPELEFFDERWWCEPARRIAIRTLAEPVIAQPVEAALDQLAGLVDTELGAGRFPLVLGGEHSITPGAIRPAVARHPDLVLLHVDAHADLRDGYLGERFSHASAIRRCLDHPGVRVVSFGIRNLSGEEARFLEEHRDRVQVFWGHDRTRWDLDRAAAWLRDRPVWITFDVDGLDASLMPATGTPEPGGLFWDDAMRVLELGAGCAGEVVGADVNELAPIAGMQAPDFVAARLAYRVLAFALLGVPHGPPL